MIFSRKNSNIIISQQNSSIVEFVELLNKNADEFNDLNTICVLFNLLDINASDLDEFLKISKDHKNKKHSFVIVSDKVSIDEVSEEISLVPTLQEAYDLIEMEEIERDLGF